MGITEQLIAFAEGPVPADALEMMQLSVLDWSACGIAGAAQGDFAAFVAAEQMMHPGASAVFGGAQASVAAAALLNGTLSHALDYDDTHFGHIGHPSVAVLPAVMALGQHISADLKTVVEAATIGVEASILVGLWLGRAHYQVGYHQTATAGAFGATLAAARLLRLDPAQTRGALGLCASLASGLKAQFGTMAKPLNAGLAARAGMQAALWAQAGMTAADDGLAGPLGFGATHHGGAHDVAIPPKRWHIMTISHKFHACCHGLHAMLEALKQATLDPGAVDSLKLHTHPRWMSVCNIADPKTGLEAKFSYRQTAAMMLLGHDTAAIASYTDDITRAPQIMAIRQRISVVPDDSLSEMQSRVEVVFKEGSARMLSHDLAQPMAIDLRTDKLRKKARALIGQRRADAVWQAIQGNSLPALTDQLVMS